MGDDSQSSWAKLHHLTWPGFDLFISKQTKLNFLLNQILTLWHNIWAVMVIAEGGTVAVRTVASQQERFRSPGGQAYSERSVYSLAHACVDSLQLLQLPPAVQRRAFGMNGQLQIDCRCEHESKGSVSLHVELWHLYGEAPPLTQSLLGFKEDYNI